MLLVAERGGGGVSLEGPSLVSSRQSAHTWERTCVVRLWRVRPGLLRTGPGLLHGSGGGTARAESGGPSCGRDDAARPPSYDEKSHRSGRVRPTLGRRGLVQCKRDTSVELAWASGVQERPSKDLSVYKSRSLSYLQPGCVGPLTGGRLPTLRPGVPSQVPSESPSLGRRHLLPPLAQTQTDRPSTVKSVHCAPTVLRLRADLPVRRVDTEG